MSSQTSFNNFARVSTGRFPTGIIEIVSIIGEGAPRP